MDILKKIKGKNASTGGGSKLVTGLYPSTIVAINPSVKEYNEITGSSKENEFVYEKRENSFTNEMVRPIILLIKNEETGAFVIKFLEVGLNPVVTKDGKKSKWIDNKGNITYYCEKYEICATNPKMEWANYGKMHHQLVTGEEVLLKVLMNYMKYDSTTEESNLIDVFTSDGLTMENIFNGNLDPLKSLVKDMNDNGHKIVFPYVVKESTKDEKTYYNQDVLVSSELIFPASSEGSILSSSLNRMESIYQKKKNDGYVITNKWFTIEPQDFNLSDCLNEVPKETPEEEGLPF